MEAAGLSFCVTVQFCLSFQKSAYDDSLPQTNLSESFEGTPAFYWLQNNAHRFHYQLSFAKGNRQGVSYEPWHWRYEGSAQALQQFEAAHRFNQSRGPF